MLAVRPAEPRRTEQLTWYDRGGRLLGTVGAPDPISTFDLSPDGRSVVIARASSTAGSGGEVLMVIDTARGVTSRLTGREFDAVDDPVWSPDSRRVAFKALSGGKSVLVVKPADGGAGRVVIDGQFDDVFVEGWSPDGRYLAINIWEGARRRGALLPVDGKPEPIPFVETATEESDFSPDGRWLAYSTSVDPGFEVFVVPVPPTGERRQVSTGRGSATVPARRARALLSRPGWDPDGGVGFERPTVRSVGARDRVDNLDVGTDGHTAMSRVAERSAGSAEGV